MAKVDVALGLDIDPDELAHRFGASSVADLARYVERWLTDAILSGRTDNETDPTRSRARPVVIDHCTATERP